jgi:flagellar biosynthesis protein FlhB
MADEDDAQKTEEPSSRKLSKAKEQGQTASSQEIKSWAILLGATFAFFFMVPTMAGQIRMVGTKFIEQPHTIATDLEHLRDIFIEVSIALVWILGPMMVVLMIMAVTANLAQSGLIWAPTKIMPDPSKISPLKGLKRMFSPRALVEFAKGIMKLVLVTVVAAALALPLFDDMALIPLTDFMFTLDRLHAIAIRVALGSLIIMTIIAAFDYMYQKYAFIQQMKMTKQEVKDEHKQSEGDPHVKARIRQVRAERARQRMMSNVPEADVVVTNPTHFAIALSYKIDEMAAPRVVAKGADYVALKIREIAEESDVPIVENAPLARALFASVEVDEEIPLEHYQAVAEVIGFVMRDRGSTVH